MVTISTALAVLSSLAWGAGVSPTWQASAGAWVEADAMMQAAVGQVAMESTWSQREKAAQQLRRHPPSAAEIERAIRSGDPATRLAAMACVVVREEPSDEIVRLLVNAVETDDPSRRLMALRALARAGGAQTSPFEARLSAALLRDPSPSVRVEAYPLLIRMEMPRAAPVFAAMFGEWTSGCPSDLFRTVASLGKAMVATVDAAIEARGPGRAREAFECARGKAAQTQSANGGDVLAPSLLGIEPGFTKMARVRQMWGDAAKYRCEEHESCWCYTDWAKGVVVVIGSGATGGFGRIVAAVTIAEAKAFQGPSQMCTAVSTLSASMRLSNGLRLGMSRREVVGILGPPSEEAGGHLRYERMVEGKLTREEVARLRAAGAALSDIDTTYTDGMGLTVQIVGERVVSITAERVQSL